jgi:glycosyltransferase involved in cell wall biosynthesis
MSGLTVLHLAANRWWTGSADPVLQLVGALRKRGHRVLLGLIPGDRFEAKAREAGIEPVPGLELRTRLAPLAFARDVRFLRGLVRAEGVDLIHCHHSHDHWLAWLAAGRGEHRVPVVRTFHNLRSVKGDRASAWLYARTTAAFAVSRQVEERCRRALPAGRVQRAPGTVDLDWFSDRAEAAAVRAELGLGDAPVVVTVARMAANRGHELLLRSFALVGEALPAARLVLVGKGEMRTRLEALVDELGLGERVVFAGYRDRDLPAVIAAADCFVLMAAGSDESCRAALEAMAVGRPVVARRVGALPDTVVHGVTGLLIEDERPESLAATLSALLSDRERATAMGLAGRQHAEREFSPERLAAVTEALYLSVLGRP